jgi:tripartite-type tricarboxylate transporter receptor subunit TctC
MGLAALFYPEWVGLFAPGACKLNAAALEALADPAAQARITEFGIFPRDRQTLTAFRAWQKAQIEQWWPLINEFGLKLD